MGASESLIQKFLTSAGERLTEFGEVLSTLRDAPNRDEVVKVLARNLHTYKGESRLLGLTEIEQLTHAAEGMLFSHQRTDSIGATTEHLLFETIDLIFVCVQARIENEPPPNEEIESVVGRLREAWSKPAESPHVPKPAPVASEGSKRGRRSTLQVDLDRLDSITDSVSNVSGALVRNRQLLKHLNASVIDLRAHLAAVQPTPATESHSHPTRDAKLHEMVEDLSNTVRDFREHHFRLDLSYGELADSVRESRLQPLRTIFVNYLPFVRSAARQEEKRIEVELRGESIRVDQQVLERIAEPCLHLLRNAVVHGIETIDERVAAGKPPNGTIVIEARQDGEFIRVEFSDDGRGIDVESVRDRAVGLGLIPASDAEDFGLHEATQQIFTSGLSTMETTNELAGRGVGLDVVASVIESMGGALRVESIPGSGTKFILIVPVSLSRTKVFLFEAGEQLFAIPSASVIELFQLPVQEIEPIEGRESAHHRHQPLPLIRLREVLGLRGIRDIFVNKVSVFVVSSGGEQAGIVVDRFVGERELVLRPFGPFLGRPQMSSGATLLEDGTIALVLNANDLLRNEATNRKRCREEAAANSNDGLRLKLLHVEDSVITRSYTANVLRARGYLVTEASDGVEALEVLQTDSFDVLLTDLQMPKLDGFKLCAIIRENAQLKELPIVVMSTLESQEAQKMAFDAGASAYVIKSSFDASTLIGAIEEVAQ